MWSGCFCGVPVCCGGLCRFRCPLRAVWFLCPFVCLSGFPCLFPSLRLACPFFACLMCQGGMLMPSVQSLIAAAPAVVVCGSRQPSTAGLFLASQVLLSVPPVPSACGCCAGIPLLWRSRFPGAGSVPQPAGRTRVFHCGSCSVFVAGRFPTRRSALVARSCQLVAWAAQRGALWLSFPSVVCPPALSSASSCWVSTGSGSWSSLALAAGAGLSCLVFPVAGWSPWPGFVQISKFCFFRAGLSQCSIFNP